MANDQRILIIEDETLIAMDLEDELADRGYAAVCASTIQRAERILQAETPFMAILDMHLRSEATFELADQLQEKGVPFIFLSGNDASSLPDNLKSSKILTKPFVMEDVIAAIAEIENKQ